MMRSPPYRSGSRPRNWRGSRSPTYLIPCLGFHDGRATRGHDVIPHPSMAVIGSSWRPMNSSASARVKTPAVVPTARTQLAPDGAGELQAFELGSAFEEADDVAGVEGVAAARAVDEGDGIGAESGRCSDSETETTPRSPRVITTRRAPSSWKARAWRTGSVSPRISSASSVLGTKTSVWGRTTLSGSR